MSLSKQERPVDQLSELDFLGGHLKIGITKPRPVFRANRIISNFENNIRTFFKSRIGKQGKNCGEGLTIGEEEDEDEEQFQWQLLPENVRSLCVRKMPLQTRVCLAATSKDERALVRSTKVMCKLFVIDDLDRRTYHLLRYPNLHWMAFARPGKKYFVNFVCDWQHDIAICFCEERRPFQGTHVATKVYWLTPSGKVKKTVIPNVEPYDLAVKTAAKFFSVITEDCKRSSISMPGWPEEIYDIPELRHSYIIGSNYDNVEAIHKMYDFFGPFSFDVQMHQTVAKYKLPFSFLEVARRGMKSWVNMRAKDQALCDEMLDKDLRILILHDSFVSQEKMREFMDKWCVDLICDRFCWWAISTHMPLEINSLLDGLNVEFKWEKFGQKFRKHHKGNHAKRPNGIRTSCYALESQIDPMKRATIIIRDKMVLFANAEVAPEIDEYGLITYKTRSGVNDTQF
ncbi:unnamed protein product [Caenorhabditis sp. 36 PRJEB53466]|nr:unnamed protein product [Caenorhabditis sp. 36 PRJEB53466]